MESWGGEGEWCRAAFLGVLACCREGPALKGGGGARREGTPGLKVAFIEGRGLKGDTARGEDMRVKGAGIRGARIVGDGVWKAKL